MSGLNCYGCFSLLAAMCTFYLDLGFGTHIYFSPAGGTNAIVAAGLGANRQEFLTAFRT